MRKPGGRHGKKLTKTIFACLLSQGNSSIYRRKTQRQGFSVLQGTAACQIPWGNPAYSNSY